MMETGNYIISNDYAMKALSVLLDHCVTNQYQRFSSAKRYVMQNFDIFLVASVDEIFNKLLSVW